MTQSPTPPKAKLIHVGRIQLRNFQKPIYLFLRQLEPCRYAWFCENPDQTEKETAIWGGTAQEAILEARKMWSENHFSLLHCGFRYTLPERDEVGLNALFHQMAASYASMNGVYFDEELGHNYIVQNASLEARNLWEQLRKNAF